MPKKARKPQRSRTRSQRKRAALAAAAQSATVAQNVVKPADEAVTHGRVPGEPTPSPPIDRAEAVREARTAPRPPPGFRGHRKSVAAVVIAGIALSAGAMASVLLAGRPQQPVGSPSPSIIVGIPGPVVLTEPTPGATTTAAPPTPGDASTPTPMPVTATAAPSPSQPTPPVPSATPPSPEPTAMIVAAATQADEAVAGFYRFVAEGDFDAAYGLWSDRMKAAYPREGNLDRRFAGTNWVSFDELRVAERSGNSATVQANFTEAYDSGSTRQFVGYWRLVLVNGRWLLDEPHY